MARAKRTERAEARRRYRAVAGIPPDAVDVEAPDVAPATLPRAARERRGASPARAAVPEARPGFMGAVRTAAGPVDLRGDLRALPSVLMSRAGWLPALVIVGTTVAMLLPGFGSSSLVALAGNIVLQPPPMIIAFLAGMLAPRAAWLMGGLQTMLASAAYLFVYFSRTDTSVTSLAFTVTIKPADKLAIGLGAIPGSLVSWAVFGIAVGAFAGFYRRFLRMSVPERQAPRRR